MRIMGIDHGERRIGVAMSDPRAKIASGIEVLQKKRTSEEDAEGIKNVISRYEEVGEVVVGLPITMAGEIGPQAQKVQAFVGILRSALTIPVKTWDERLTTVQADRIFMEAGIKGKKKKKYIDKTAAAFILQNYLDYLNHDKS